MLGPSELIVLCLFGFGFLAVVAVVGVVLVLLLRGDKGGPGNE
jgi:hypothetical protein